MTEEYQIALEVFKSLQSDFPKLQMELSKEPKGLELEMIVPAQPGMDFSIELNLQNEDELHIGVGAFWCEWFPCTDPEKTSEYVSLVKGIMSGKNRIEVHKRGGRPVKATLQKPDGEGWVNVATWSKLHIPWGSKSVEYIQNHNNT